MITEDKDVVDVAARRWGGKLNGDIILFACEANEGDHVRILLTISEAEQLISRLRESVEEIRKGGAA